MLPSDPATRHRCLQPVMFQLGGVGRIFGQDNPFANYAPVKLRYAMEPYTNEVAHLRRVLNKRLGERAFLGGPEHSIVGIRTFPWFRNPDRRGRDLGACPAIRRWQDAIAEPPAVQRGVQMLADQRRVSMTEVEREDMFGQIQCAMR